MIKLKTNLKVLRAIHNLTQEELANKVDVSRNTINNLERGEFSPSLLLVWKIAKLFNKQIEEIFYYDEQ
jgi:putative transcriptional regulator